MSMAGRIAAGIHTQFDVFPALRYATSWHVLAVSICQLLAITTPVVIALVTGRLVEMLTRGADAANGVWPLLGAFAAATVLGWTASALVGPVTSLLAGRTDAVARGRLFMLPGRPGTYRSLESGDFADDLARVAGGIGSGRSLGRGAVAQIENLGKVIAAAGLCWVVARVSVLLAVVLFMCVLLVRNTLIRELDAGLVIVDEHASAQRRGKYLHDLVCTPFAAKDVHTFGLGHWVVGRYRDEMRTYFQALFALRRRLVTREARLVPVFFLVAATAFIWPAVAAVHGDISMEVMVAAIMASAALFGVVQAGHEQMYIAPARAALRALGRVETALARPASGTGIELPIIGVPPTIRFTGVRFGYDDRVSVLDGVDLEIRPGEVLAVVGVNGAGKTTLTKLLAGLYQPQRGRVTADGVDIAELDAVRWHERLAMVFQDFVRYPLSAQDNIVLAVPGLAMDEDSFLAAIEGSATATLFRRLPHGGDTPLSRIRTGGVELSGGQWQKIAIARALFAVHAGARILVLDEPTAHLDTRAEADFFDRVIAEAAGLTVVLISHRLSTVRRADRIVLLDGGRIAEAGTHAELLEIDGHYAAMFRAQAARFAESNTGGVR